MVMIRRIVGFFLRMLMVWRCTSCGNCGTARATRFCTWTSAFLTFVPSLKVTVRPYEPSLLEFDDMYCIPSRPLTCCSIGAATVSATTPALAPGYEHETFTVGG